MSRDEIFEAFEELESLARRARCMAWFLDDAISGVMPPRAPDGHIFATELDRDLINFARAEVLSTCDTVAASVASLHKRIRAGWKAEDATAEVARPLLRKARLSTTV